MKVNIQYLIELDEIPEKVKKFLIKASELSADIDDEIGYAVSLIEHDCSVKEQLNYISKVRDQLENINGILLDCSQILHGYEEVATEQPEAIPNWPLPDPEEELSLSESNDQIKLLSERLKSLQEVYHDNKTRDEETEEG